MSDLLQVSDLERAKLHDTFHSEVVTGKSGGVASGADIDYATNAVTSQVQKTLPKILDDLDWSPVGKFVDGVTFTKTSDFALDGDNTQWIYIGDASFPVTVAAGFNPVGNADYQVIHVSDHNSLSNRNAAGAHDASAISYSGGGSVDDALASIEIGSYTVPTFQYAVGNSHKNYVQLKTLGHSLPSCGGATYIRSGETSTPSTGDEALFYDADGVGWELDKSQKIDIEMFGALNTDSDITDNLIAAANFLSSGLTLSANIGQFRALHVPRRDTSFVVGALTGSSTQLTGAMSKIILVGDGDISGVYRHTVARETDPTSLSFCNVTPNHLPVFTAEKNPVVVIVGDSLSSLSADENGGTNLMWNSICREIAQQCPNKNITFYNRALGGQTMAGLDGTPIVQSYYPDWFQSGVPWIEQINSLNPHLVIISMGMNDGSTISPVNIQSVRGKIRAGTNNPDIIWGTTPTPHRGELSDPATFATKTAQEARDWAAGLVRTQAIWHGDGYLDFNRQINIVRDGRDVWDTQLIRVDSLTTQAAGAYVMSKECSDFAVDLELDTSGVSSSQTFLSFRFGRKSDNIVQLSTVAGKLRALVIAQGGFSPNNIHTTFDVPIAANTSVRLEKRGSILSIRFGGYQVAPQVLLFNAVSTGGEFFPAFGNYPAFTSGIVTKYTGFAGIPKRYKPSMIDNDIFGHAATWAGRKTPAGGNGINHYSGSGVAAVVDPVLHNAKFS